MSPPWPSPPTPPRPGNLNARPGEQPDPATQPGPPPPPLVDRTGFMPIDAFGDVLNEGVAPFRQTPPSNPVCAAAHYVNAALGILTTIDRAHETYVALLTAPLNAILPPMPACQLYTPMIGLPHTHVHPPSLVPPAPPVPLPSIGAAMLPGALSVLVKFIPGLRAGDIGPAIACGTFGPPFEIMTGSANVFFAGSRAARMMRDLTFHDNPSPLSAVGAVMAAVGSVSTQLNVASQLMQGRVAAAAMTAAQQAAEIGAMAMKMLRYADPGGPPSVGALIRGWPTVLVGGMPIPNISASGMILEAVASVGRGIIRKLESRNRGGSGPDGPHPGQPCRGGVGPHGCPK